VGRAGSGLRAVDGCWLDNAKTKAGPPPSAKDNNALDRGREGYGEEVVGVVPGLGGGEVG
jgi:hypothetical protein